ncbi:MAG: hypothetical protein KC910_36680, partial [Candidatus Eremiobacteraeota bacterium]|nr:hypothetical protein [Candidatus Eremiobacteraeota bacterium]
MFLLQACFGAKMMKMRVVLWIFVLSVAVTAQPSFPPVQSSGASLVHLDQNGRMVKEAEKPQPVELRSLRRRRQPRFRTVYSNPWWYYQNPIWCPPASDPTWRQFNTHDPWCSGYPYLY